MKTKQDVYTFEMKQGSQDWQQSSKRFDTYKEAIQAASDWLLVNAQNYAYPAVRIVRLPSIIGD